MSLNEKRVFALVPARAGSKGIPQKNIYPINGKPLIDFTLDAAVASQDIDEVFVSSDSRKILEHVISKQVNTILRPKDIAKDNSSAVDVVKHQTHIVEDEMSHEADKQAIGYIGKTIYQLMKECSLNEEDELELMNYVHDLAGIWTYYKRMI